MERSNVLLNKHYLDEIRETPCVACYIERNISETPTVPHHESVGFRFKDHKRGSDYYALPLCPYHHDARHKTSSIIFWAKLTGNSRFPMWAVLEFMLRYANQQNIYIDPYLLKVYECNIYYTFSERETRIYLDEIADHLHYTWTTGDDLRDPDSQELPTPSAERVS